MTGDGRTDEQRAADTALTEAITGVLAAYDDSEGDRGVLTEYVAVSAWQSWDDDGDGLTAIAVSPMNGDVPLHRLTGLLDYALTRMRARITDDER